MDGLMDASMDMRSHGSCSLLPLLVSAEIYGKRKYLDVFVITRKFVRIFERMKKPDSSTCC